MDTTKTVSRPCVCCTKEVLAWKKHDLASVCAECCMTDFAVGAVWQHGNGILYEIVGVANNYTADTGKYPVRIVYRNLMNGRLWDKTLTDFLSKMSRRYKFTWKDVRNVR